MDKYDIESTLRAAGLFSEELHYLEDYQKKLRDNLELCIECNIDPFPLMHRGSDALLARMEAVEAKLDLVLRHAEDEDVPCRLACAPPCP